jgi:hypothetical protein
MDFPLSNRSGKGEEQIEMVWSTATTGIQLTNVVQNITQNSVFVDLYSNWNYRSAKRYRAFVMV